MDKLISLLGKNVLIAITGVVVVAGGVYAGTREEELSVDSPQVAQVDSKTSSETKADPAYVNTQWNDAVGGTKGMPVNWPKDAPPAYPGAMLLTSYTHEYGTAGKSNPSVNYLTNVSGADITDYYVKGLNANEWKIEANADSPAGYRVITAKKDTRSFSAFISIVQTGGKTGVTSGVTF